MTNNLRTVHIGSALLEHIYTLWKLYNYQEPNEFDILLIFHHNQYFYANDYCKSKLSPIYRIINNLNELIWDESESNPNMIEFKWSKLAFKF